MINTSSPIDRSGLTDVGELAEIPRFESAEPIFKSRPFLLPGEEEASLPEADYPIDPTLATLKQMLGARLTVDSQAWVGDPIPRMRALQKKMIEFSLTQDESERGPCMDAIRIVDLAVRWRLRWQQMRRSDLEGNPAGASNQKEENDEEKEAA
ncbi:hypothetical protein [Herbaspirillum sp. RV1423]|uniref:hypothetical protein n=1 Tax=Herbaspirillum sp. RV1423 TaxID=1443993 RepID=UPI0012DE05DD|nr:hypothetical protein [Herbaspirillum sp. RV1423]